MTRVTQGGIFVCLRIFVRKKRNRSGTTSVVAVDKSSGGFRELKSFGVARSDEEADRLCRLARAWIRSYGGQEEIDFEGTGREREEVQRISVEHTRRLLGGRVGIAFYDVTTLYFESSVCDGLRDTGFSKDGRTAETQVVLGLLVSEGGHPLSYSLYSGSQYEGLTLIPMIDDFRQRFSIGEDFIVVADSGFMGRRNVELLRRAGYRYIIGARIRSEGRDMRDWILGCAREDGAVRERVREDGERLIVGYSSERARKDEYNRRRGVARLRRAYSRGTLTKEHVNRRGYNKFLDISKDVRVSINEDKIAEDGRWDGLKGYVTNTELDARTVIESHHGLFEVEAAFRVGKSTLEMRPIFHFTERRIEAHICICFMAFSTIGQCHT